MLLGTLPTEIQALYIDMVEVGSSAYSDFKAPAEPWRWCHSESYIGNAWRVTFNADTGGVRLKLMLHVTENGCEMLTGFEHQAVI